MDYSAQRFFALAGMIVSTALPLTGILLCMGLFRNWRRGAYYQTIGADVGRLRARNWQTADALLLLCAIMLPIASAVTNSSRREAVHVTPTPGMEHIAPYLAYYALLLLGVGVAAQRTSLGIGAAMGITRAASWPAIRTGIILGLAMLPPALLAAGLADNLCQWLGTPPSRQAVFDVLNAPHLDVIVKGALFFMAIVAAPLAEEAIFRGVLFPRVLQKHGVFVALLLVNVLFALLHLHAPSFLPLLVVGICFSLGMLATGSVLTPIVMHAIFNGEMLLLFYAWA